MTNAELIQEVAARANIKNAEADRALKALGEVVIERTGASEDVSLAGFGKFKLGIRAARTMKNPQNGEPVEVPETRVLRFTLSSIAKKELNN